MTQTSPRASAFARVPFDADVAALLKRCDLPTADLGPGTRAVLYGARIDDALAGLVGLEFYGEAALLRSLAVTPEQRRTGLGRVLVAHAEAEARRAGAQDLYLLTTTAAGYFELRGYRHLARKDAPAAIAGTAQFTSLCPSSSAFMRKELAPEPAG